MSNHLTIQESATKLGVSTKTLRRWEKSGYFVTERDLNTNTRLYDPKIVDYWKKLLELDRSLKKHLELLEGLRKELSKHMLEQDYKPGKKLKLFEEKDIKNCLKASEDIEKWEKKRKAVLNSILQYPRSMLKATIEY